MGGLIGTSVPRREAPAKVTGSSRFADDIEVAGAWFGATIRAEDPHSRLLAVERDPAFDWSAVTLVTAADIPGENVVTIVSDDFPILAFDEIRYSGQAVALVAAPTPALARAACSAVRLRTNPLPAVFDPLASDVDFARYEIVRGDVEAGFAAAEFVLEAEYRTGAQEHAYLEPQAMIASPAADGGVVITGSMQCPYYIVAPRRGSSASHPTGSPSSRPRPVAGSAARRTTHPWSAATPPCSPAPRAGRSGSSTAAMRTSSPRANATRRSSATAPGSRPTAS